MANLSNLLTGQSNLVTDQDLAAVATTGSYTDLVNKPTIPTGSYTDLTNKPTLATVATSGSYADLTNKPSLSAVATSGSYADLSNKPIVISLKVTAIGYPGDDLAADPAGSQQITITGTGFESTPTVYIGGTIAPAVTFVSSTQISVITPAKTAGTYDIYIVNPGGATAIMVFGISYSGLPSWTTPAGSLGIQESNWTVQLQATSNSAVTYALTSGSTLPSGVTLSSSGLITGTNVSVEQTFNFSVTAVDAENQDTSRSFSVTISIADPYFKYTTLLINGDTLATTTFNKDSSTNNAEVLVAGNTRADNLTPYSGNPTFGSVYFNGSTDYLKVPNSGLFGSGDWTIEFWVRSPAPQSDKSIIEARNSAGSTGSTAGFTLTLITGSEIRLWSGGEILRGSVTYVNQWVHVAVTKSGGTTKMYLNGVSVGTSTALGNMSDTEFHVATGYYGSTSLNTYTNMYISDLRVVKGSAVYSTNFTPPTTPLTAITNTVLLTAQYKGQPNNNLFLDSGPANLTINRVGTPMQGTFSPYGATWSNYFSGSDNLTTSTNSAFTLGTGNFTIEMWYNPSVSYVTGNGYLFDMGSNGTRIQLYQNTVYFLPVSGDYVQGPVGVGMTVGEWNHVAAVRNGSTITLYVNGTSVGSATNSNNQTDTQVRIGGYGGNLTNAFTGYISNFRLVKGTAVYTSNFIPPISPLTTISGTSLLACNSNRFVDTSTNNFAIAINNTPSVQRFSPFPPTSPYSASTLGGSVYFNPANSEALTFPTSSEFTLGTNDFTVEAWVYISDITTRKYIYAPGNDTASHTQGFGLEIWDNRLCMWATSGSDWNMLECDTSANRGNILIPQNAWTHVAAVRTGGNTFKSYVNGVLDRTFTNSGSIVNNGSGQILNIGRTTYLGSYAPFNGYISDLRVVNGTAVYTAAFTPPTTPLTAITNTKVLTKFANASIIDNTMMNNIRNVGNTQISTNVVKYGAGSMYFDGSGDGIMIVTPNPTFALGTGDFTIECWINTNVNSGDGFFRRIYMTDGPTGNASGNFQIAIEPSTGYVNLWETGGALNELGNSNVCDGVWHHIAATRSSSTLRLFVDGVQQISTTYSRNIVPNSSNPRPYIGTYDGSAGTFSGYIDEFRITKGFARYTANFTPPTAAFKTK
jgi:hypothetical protein